MKLFDFIRLIEKEHNCIAEAESIELGHIYLSIIVTFQDDDRLKAVMSIRRKDMSTELCYSIANGKFSGTSKDLI